jgi:hypothetical protein
MFVRVKHWLSVVTVVAGGLHRSLALVTAAASLLVMRETYSLRCRLVDHALALPGENNALEAVTCIVTAERYPRRHCQSVQSGREGTCEGVIVWALENRMTLAVVQTLVVVTVVSGVS